ncbi:MAG: hypothetical protein NZM04_07830 [Methylacidiphilales bacterium]|nr:hypothetical protein [Candidatus Methylacidiphilales bacterium]MDW8349572.1 hypothetical protein [Verrucomicrobiae bacterium]
MPRPNPIPPLTLILTIPLLLSTPAYPQNIKFRFNPPLHKKFIEERTRRVITDNGITTSTYQETWRTLLHHEREADNFALIRTVQSITAQQDNKPVTTPAGSFYQGITLTYIIDPHGSLLEVHGNDQLLQQALQAIPEADREAFRAENTPQKMFTNQKEEWDRRLGYLAGKTLKIGQRIQRQLPLPGLPDVTYTLTLEIQKAKIQDGRPWITLITASSTDPDEIETLLEAAKQNQAEEAILSKKTNAAFVYRGISQFTLDANTMLIADDYNYSAYIQATVIGDKTYFRQARYELDQVKITPQPDTE